MANSCELSDIGFTGGPVTSILAGILAVIAEILENPQRRNEGIHLRN